MEARMSSRSCVRYLQGPSGRGRRATDHQHADLCTLGGTMGRCRGSSATNGCMVMVAEPL
eukprot:10014298-Prorocentrum_lima.AAC.1